MCKKKNGIRNLDDQGAKFVFKDPELCAQLLKISLSPDRECYMVAVIEHQSEVDYKMPIKILRYEVIRVQDYTNEEIISKGNELSLIMLINKLKDSGDMKSLTELPETYLDQLEQKSPEHLRKLLRDYVTVFMRKLNLPEQEIAEVAERIERRKGSMWFDNFEGYDIQEVRRSSREKARAEEIMNTERERQRAERAEAEVARLQAELQKYKKSE